MARQEPAQHDRLAARAQIGAGSPLGHALCRGDLGEEGRAPHDEIVDRVVDLVDLAAEVLE